MNKFKVSGGIVIVPESRFECFLLWMVGLKIGGYEKTYIDIRLYPMSRSYPMMRRLKIEWSK